eukprot:5145331-Pyramimonas_sp.AAC.1
MADPATRPEQRRSKMEQPHQGACHCLRAPPRRFIQDGRRQQASTQYARMTRKSDARRREAGKGQGEDDKRKWSGSGARRPLRGHIQRCVQGGPRRPTGPERQQQRSSARVRTQEEEAAARLRAGGRGGLIPPARQAPEQPRSPTRRPRCRAFTARRQDNNRNRKRRNG